MLFEPTLQVTRLQIERGALIAYDEPFHGGINVIRGENSSGKSTIINSVFYGLGGDLTRWSDAALLCTRVNVEVLLNGKVATLSREISAHPGQPMDIFGGTLAQSVEAPRSEWLRFPYRRSEGKESFSQAIFRLLNIPEASNEISGNITVHQILRLLYSDQLSPIEELFRSEPFDSANIRQSVARLLCGAFDEELYANELRIRELSREYEEKQGELRSLLKVLGRSDMALTKDWLEAERSKLNQERAELLKAISASQLAAAMGDSDLTLVEQAAAYERVRTTQGELSRLREERDRLAFEITDSRLFIESLERKRQALSDAALTAEELGDVRYSHCPACHAVLEPECAEGECHLCSQPFKADHAQKRIVAISNDISIQLRQSRSIQEDREVELAAIERKINELTRIWERQAAEFNVVRQSPLNPAQAELNRLQHQLGYLDKATEDLDGKGRLVEEVTRLAEQKDALNVALTKLKTRNEFLKAQEAERLSKAYTEISNETRWFVSHDLRREDAFEDPRAVQIDFEKNRILVDGQAYFSASSRVILKNSFMMGFLFAALQDRAFRHPRISLIDTIEDKGMEPVRSQNFQNLLRERSDNASVDHQVIFATSMISPDLDEEQFTVGHFATRDNPTLRIG